MRSQVEGYTLNEYMRGCVRYFSYFFFFSILMPTSITSMCKCHTLRQAHIRTHSHQHSHTHMNMHMHGCRSHTIHFYYFYYFCTAFGLFLLDFHSLNSVLGVGGWLCVWQGYVSVAPGIVLTSILCCPFANLSPSPPLLCHGVLQHDYVHVILI